MKLFLILSEKRILFVFTITLGWFCPEADSNLFKSRLSNLNLPLFSILSPKLPFIKKKYIYLQKTTVPIEQGMVPQYSFLL